MLTVETTDAAFAARLLPSENVAAPSCADWWERIRPPAIFVMSEPAIE